MSKGWVSIHRSICDNFLWFEEPFTKAQAWIDLILNANHKENTMLIRGNVIKLKRGQIGWSELTMASRWRWSRNKVRHFLKLLEIEHQIGQQKVYKITTIIDIINYDRYQNGTTDDTTEGQQKDNRRYTNNNDNNENNIYGSEKSEPSRKDISYKKEQYIQVISAYQRLRGVTLHGKEFEPIQQAIKTMFMCNRTPEDIIYVMEWLSNGKEEWTKSWTINTVKIKLPLILAERDKVRKKQEVRSLTNLEKMGVYKDEK
jgi:hypothetical protein